MTYIPNQSLRKAIGSVRIVHNGAGAADLFIDDGASSALSFATLNAWQEIFASTTETVKAIEIFDATGEIARVGTGSGGSEVIEFRVIPGGNGLNYFQIDGAARIALAYESAVPSANSETIINFYR